MGHFGRRPIQLAVADPGLPVAGAELPGPGRPRAGQARGAGEPVLPAGPGLGAAAHGAPGHGSPP
jgi:hypothetical protein